MPTSRISLLFEPGQTVPRSRELAALAGRVARGEGLKGGVDIVFCADQKVRALNKRYRKLDKVTDVLSFGWDEEDFAGEIYVANPQAKRQAPRFNNNYFNELRRLVVHGMLHLCGHDHMKTVERRVMRQKEDFYLGNPAVTSPKSPPTSPVRSAKNAPKTGKTTARPPKKSPKKVIRKAARPAVSR